MKKPARASVRPWEDALDLGLMALLARVPGLLWGCHLFSNAPFIFLSWDEWSITHGLPGWLADIGSARKDYVYGFGRQMYLALPIARLLGNANAALHILFSTRLTNVALGAATVVLLYRIARLLNVERVTALLAGAFLALAPLHVSCSHYATPTVSLVFWVYLSFFGFLSYRVSRQPAYWLLGCAAAGVAIAVKFGFICCIPLVYLLVRADEKLLIKVGGLIALGGAFYYFNFGDLPWRRLDVIKSILMTDNFVERVHPRWFNPVVFLFDLMPSMGLPAFVCAAAGVAGYGPTAERDSAKVGLSRMDRFACLEFPLLVYFVSIWSMTSIFLRHLVLLLPFLALVAAQGFRRLEATIVARRGARAARAVLYFILAYQGVATIWIEHQHLVDRVWLGMQWVEKNVPAGKKVYIAEGNNYDLTWKEDFEPSLITTDPEKADFLFITENIVWLFRRSQLTPLTANPTKEQVYHWRYMKDPEFLNDIAHDRAPFTRIANFPATEILPEFILYKWIFNTFNSEYGDVSVYARRGA